MCGLVAIFKPNEGRFEPEILESMTHSLTHRGPDDYGFAFVGPENTTIWKENTPAPMGSAGVAMGHRRLSILDLSAGGRQPFASSDERYWIVYNGEIYNYLEIQQELLKLGYKFRTHTDTEILLTAYEAWGTDCFAKFNGMWAVVIWDNKDKTLVVCRDRFGVKPLYFSRVGQDWLFASEMKALLLHKDIKAEPNKRAVFDYLLDNIPPSGEETLFTSINSVEPGTCLRLSPSGVEKKRFWDLKCDHSRQISALDEGVEEFRHLFSSSVQIRLRSDVKVGTTLSGGLDSTTIVRTITDLLSVDTSARRAVGDSIEGFNASYPGHALDETDKVDELCNSLKIHAHKVLPMEIDEVEELMGDVTYHMETPFNSSIPLVNTLLMRRARTEGVKVLLNGHGADELFAGYPAVHCSLAVADAMRGFRWGRASEEIRGMTVNHGHSWKWALRDSLRHMPPMRCFVPNRDSGEKLLMSKFNQQYIKEHGTALDRQEKYIFPGRSELDRALKTQFFRDMVPRWLHMEDRISMAASVESRLPFLDYRLVEFAFKLDNSLKVKSGVTKFILRKAMEDKLPKSIVSDTKKHFFPGPDVFWLTGPLKSLLLSKLTLGTPRVTEFIGLDAVKSLINEYLQGNHRNNRLVWRLLHTEMWMERFA